MSTERRSRLVLPVWKILLMHAPFRLLRHGGPGFAPGVRASAAWGRRMVWHALFDRERLKYGVIRFRQMWPISGRSAKHDNARD